MRQSTAIPGHLTYPHNHGWTRDGRLALGRWIGGERAVVLRDADGGETEVLRIAANRAPEQVLWFDLARARDLLVAVWDDAVWAVDLRDGSQRALYRAPAGMGMGSLAGIHPAGDRVVATCGGEGRWRLVMIPVDGGPAATLVHRDRWLNHAHFSPCDPDWVVFCHEGPTETVSDRLWAWHHRLAPAGRCLFDQRWSDPATRLFIGHERACQHAPAAVVVAYGVSPGQPRGLWEVPFQGEPRLVSGGDRDWHGDASPDGRWYAVDTTGPWDLPGNGWAGAEGRSDVVLIDGRDGSRLRLAGASSAHRHPHHPHPVFAPDGRSLWYNCPEMVDGQPMPHVRRIDLPPA